MTIPGRCGSTSIRNVSRSRSFGSLVMPSLARCFLILESCMAEAHMKRFYQRGGFLGRALLANRRRASSRNRGQVLERRARGLGKMLELEVELAAHGHANPLVLDRHH